MNYRFLYGEKGAAIMMKKVIIDKLQNEKAAKEYGGEIEIGKEYDLPFKGKCAFYSNYYQLEDSEEEILNKGGGFPIGTAHDSENNEYSVWLDKSGIGIYLKVYEEQSEYQEFEIKGKVL